MSLTTKLDLWIENDWNVLFEGGHGIGKTSIINSAFNRHNLNWQYFSAPTMDPWVDLVGVPKEKVDKETGTSYLDLIRPRAFEEDTVEAIFIDEFNRAQKKTTNAIMELLQFKSINGRKFHNLRFVWAAINPVTDDERYHVEAMDLATEDRFIIQTTLPSEPDLAFFTNKYGEHLGARAVDWWNNTLPVTSQHLVSPRRLDYALEVFQEGGDLNDALKSEARPNTLKRRLEQITKTSTHTERWLRDPDTYIGEVADRRSTIDVVEAMTDLVDLSLDQAVGYVSDLPAPKLNELSKTPTTMKLLLRAQKASPTRRLTTAITSVHRPLTASMSDAESRFNKLQHTDVELFALVSAAVSATSAVEPWDRLLTNILTRTQETLLEYDDCQMLLVFAAESRATSSSTIVDVLTQYVLKEHHEFIVDFVASSAVAVVNNL